MKIKLIIAVLAVAFLAGCTSSPRPKMEAVNLDGCRAVEGSEVKVDRKGHPVYRYNCNGKTVWSVQP